MFSEFYWWTKNELKSGRNCSSKGILAELLVGLKLSSCFLNLHKFAASTPYHEKKFHRLPSGSWSFTFTYFELDICNLQKVSPPYVRRKWDFLFPVWFCHDFVDLCYILSSVLFLPSFRTPTVVVIACVGATLAFGVNILCKHKYRVPGILLCHF